MPPETNVEYRTSTNFPVLHTEFQDFLPGQVPGKSLVIYEPKQPVLNELYPECIFVRIQDSETVSLYATSEHSLGRLLSAPKNVMGYYFGVIQNGQESRVTKRSCPQGGFRNDLPLWVVKDGKVINQSPNPIFYS